MKTSCLIVTRKTQPLAAEWEKHVGALRARERPERTMTFVKWAQLEAIAQPCFVEVPKVFYPKMGKIIKIPLILLKKWRFSQKSKE